MPTDTLSATFSALADPTRRAILARLASGECSVTELAKPFDMSLPGVSKHLRVLERAGLITQGREAQWRPCRIAGGPLKQVSDWTEGAKTRMTATCVYPSREVRDMVLKSGMDKGAAISYDRLEDVARALAATARA